jgi:hypothetical protein
VVVRFCDLIEGSDGHDRLMGKNCVTSFSFSYVSVLPTTKRIHVNCYSGIIPIKCHTNHTRSKDLQWSMLSALCRRFPFLFPMHACNECNYTNALCCALRYIIIVAQRGDICKSVFPLQIFPACPVIISRDMSSYFHSISLCSISS